jgi:phospholipid/cholesterol/gamma-HCH transport system substrate-binding protein
MPAKKNDFTATEIKAGILVLASLVVLAGFVGAIRGCGSAGEKVNTFSAEFTNISGLNLGAEVRFGGVKVGRVVDISAGVEDRSSIRVVFEVPATVPVNHGSLATIEQISLTTAKHLEITTGDKNQPLHVDGDRINAKTYEGGAFGIPDLEGVVARLETVLDGLVTLLGVERAKDLEEATGEEMVDLAAVTAALERTLNAGTSTVEAVGDTIAENRDGLRELVDRLANLGAAADELLTNLNAAVDENREPLNETLVNFSELSDEAARQVEALTASLAQTLQYLEEVSGNTSHLVEKHGPTLEQVLINLESTTRSLRRFSEALSEQPNVLVRGSKPKGRPDGGK